MKTIKIEEAMSNLSQVIDDLTYINYKYNRLRSPSITPEQWVKAYGDKVWEMEKRMEREEKKIKEAIDDNMG